MDIYNKQLLDNHYKNIFIQNRDILKSGGTGDTFLTSPASDTRMSIALLIRIDVAISNNINAHLGKIKTIEPDLYYYPQEDFHITVIDILKGMPGRTVPSNIEDYIGCIKEYAKKIEPFYICFENMTASDNALLVCGYYEYPLEELRESLRSSFSEHRLPLEERYQTFSSHITVARIPDKLNSPKAYMDTVQLPVSFGKMKVRSLELVYHNWYDSKKQVLARIDLL